MMQKYLMIKNAIITLLLTILYMSWLVEGISVLKVIIACVFVFVAFINLLQKADKHFMEAIGYSEKKMSASAGDQMHSGN